MDELQRFSRGAGAILVAALVLVAVTALLVGHGEIVTGVVAGGLVGFANLVLLVRMARRLVGVPVTSGLLQVAAMLRIAVVGGLVAVVLIWGHVHPVGAVIGYGIFPVAASAAGFWVLRAPVPLAR